jgi:type VI secretion system Hcp family effector
VEDDMAFNAYASLTANGTPLFGDVSITSIGGVDVSSDHIELHEVLWGARIGTEGQSRRAATERVPLPLSLTKPVDSTTPELYQALARNADIAGEIKIFDTNPEDGTTRHRFSLLLQRARIASISSVAPGPFRQEGPDRPYEVVELVPHTLTYRDVVNGKEYTDEWSTAV